MTSQFDLREIINPYILADPAVIPNAQAPRKLYSNARLDDNADSNT